MEGVDIKDVDQMQELLKKIILNMRGAAEPAVPVPGEADGEDEKAFKSSRGREGGGNPLSTGINPFAAEELQGCLRDKWSSTQKASC